MLQAGEAAAELPLAEGVAQAVSRVAGLPGLRPGDAAVLSYTVRLALAPRRMQASHLSPLRAAGFTDDEVHDIVHVVSCFSYMNRLADGLGVAVDASRQAWATQLLGPALLSRHRSWAGLTDPVG